MKKIIAFIFAVAFAFPIFAFTVKVGDNFAYLPSSNGKDTYSVVTKIAPASNGAYELTLFANGISYSYVVTDGTELDLYAKSSPKAKVADAKKLTVTSVSNNIIEFEAAKDAK